MITQENLFSEPFNLIKEFIRENINDPRKRFKKQWVHASFPNVASQSFNGYPFIVLSINLNEKNPSFDQTHIKEYRILFSIYSDENTEVDNIADEIMSKIRNLTNIQVITLASSNYTYNVIEGKKIINRQIGLIGKVRI